MGETFFLGTGFFLRIYSDYRQPFRIKSKKNPANRRFRPQIVNKKSTKHVAAFGGQGEPSFKNTFFLGWGLGEKNTYKAQKRIKKKHTQKHILNNTCKRIKSSRGRYIIPGTKSFMPFAKSMGSISIFLKYFGYQCFIQT